MANVENGKRIAEARRPRWVSGLLVVLAALYLVGIFLEAVGSRWPSRALPRSAVYFLQVAKLFPRAARMSIDYRAEGWLCENATWAEIDVRPYFPIERDNKENRFHRGLFFFRRDRQTMQALEKYVIESHQGSLSSQASVPRSQRIGGIRFSSLRIPLPKPGETIERYSRKPLAVYPESQQKAWYFTPQSRREERCRSLMSSP